MAQIFHPSANTIARVSLFGILVVLAGVAVFPYVANLTGWNTRAWDARDQPVPFSHKHHVSDCGIDCRYCHTTVETSSFAGIPPTETCMSCHSQIFADSQILEPVRASFRDGVPIQWTRVHDLPAFVFFNHSIHINKGMGCSTCHGRVDLMPLTMQVESLQMGWCLGCHRDPAKYIRPRDQVFNMAYQPPPNQEELGKNLVKQYNVSSLTDCYTCHR
jgi:cytochrome c7-like protein